MIIMLVCNIVMFVSLLIVSFCNKKLRKHNKELEIEIKRNKKETYVVNNSFQQSVKIEPVFVSHSKYLVISEDKRFEYGLGFVKKAISEKLAEKLIAGNFLIIEDEGLNYEGKILLLKKD